MEVQYLQENVGDVLAQALAATLVQNPPDYIEYLADRLVAHVTQKKLVADVCFPQ